jgi:hypothetical protein
VFISHGREDRKFQPRVVDLITAIDSVPHLLPRADTYPDDRIGFIDRHDAWRDRIHDELARVHAAVVCLDTVSGESAWVRREAGVLLDRARSQPGFRVYFLHDGEMIAHPDQKPWVDWDPLRPQDRQLTPWSDQAKLIAEISRLPEVRPLGDTPTTWLVAALTGCCRSDTSFKSNLIDTMRLDGSPFQAFLDQAVPSVAVEALDPAWAARTYVDFLVECRRSGAEIRQMRGVVNEVAVRLNAAVADDPNSALRIYRDLLPLLPTEREVSEFRLGLDPGVRPQAHLRSFAEARSADPEPLVMSIGPNGIETAGGRIDLRVAITGCRPEFVAVDGAPNHCGAQAAVGGSDAYLVDVLMQATGVATSGDHVEQTVHLFEAGDFAIEGAVESVVDVLRTAIADSPTGGCEADDYVPMNGGVGGIGAALPVPPGHIIVRCASFRSARRFATALKSCGPEDDERRPRCTVLLDVNGAKDEPGAVDLPRLVLDADRVAIRAGDQRWIDERKREGQ